jgi:hypothetical protein
MTGSVIAITGSISSPILKPGMDPLGYILD